MKRIVLISAAAVAAMLLSFSCRKEEQTGDNPGRGEILTVTADIGEVVSDTKTYIDGTEESPKTYWSEGDSIKLFNTDGNSAVYVISNWSSKATKATFTPVGSALTGTFACAYYPADSAKSYSGGKITANIPSAQKYVAGGTSENAGTFAKGISPMVGTGTLDATKGNLNLTFKNLFGVLQLTFKSNDTVSTISRIDVASAADTAFFGKLTVTPQETEEGTPSCNFETPDESWRQVSLVMDSPVTLDGTNGTSFYIVLPAGVNTARIGVTTNVGLYYRDVTKSVERSHIKSLPASTLSDAGFSKAAYSEAADSAAVMVEGIIWAPVNCGYDKDNYKYGRLYQWGRKYGQGYDHDSDVDGDYPGKAGGNQSIYDISTKGPFTSHPDVYYYNGRFYKGQYAWYTGDDIDALWNGISKGTYDPCPTGWRVPAYTELNVLTGNNGSASIGSAGWDSTKKGYWFNGTKTPKSSEGLFFPATGYRNYNNGSASTRGSNGYYWSSSVNNIYAKYLSISSSSASIISNARANGYSVRCVHD